jgi:acylphosphatase
MGDGTALRVLVTGKVQGVCFRDSTRARARAAGMTGWVCNLPDGRVEAFLQGSSVDVTALLNWIRAGGPAAAVVTDALILSAEPDEEAFEFEVLARRPA